MEVRQENTNTKIGPDTIFHRINLIASCCLHCLTVDGKLSSQRGNRSTFYVFLRNHEQPCHCIHHHKPGLLT